MRKGKLHLLPISSKRVLVSTSLMMLLTGSGWAATSPEVAESANAITAVAQQQKTIKGTVKDAAGEPIIGANVIVKGTTIGVITDIDGNFTLQIPANGTLQISYIGYLNQEIKIGAQTSYDVVLQEDNKTLDEVVVVGYGVQKKVNLTGSVASVDFEEQAKSRPVTNVSSALAGLSSGVQVMQTSGQPGEDGASIKIRGIGTMNNSEPLIIIDGMEGTMDAVNPQDIDNISILKDAASCAIYGARAANGVILITTKRGSKDRLNISYSGRISYAQPTNLIDQISNYADYMEWLNESFENIGKNKHFAQSTIDLWREKAKDPNGVNERGVPNYVAFPNTNWQDEIFQHGLINDHNVSVSGGSDKIRFLMSAGYMDNPGLVENTGMTRYSLRANIEADATKWLTVGTRIFASQEDKDAGDFKNANNYLRQTTPGLYPKWNGQYGFPEAPEESATANSIYAFLNAVDGTKKKTRVNTTMYTKVKIIKGLTWDFNFNYQRRWDEERTWTHAAEKVKFSDGTVGGTATAPSQMSTSFDNYSNYSYTLENLINYHTSIGKHDIGALAGYQEWYYYEYNTSGSKKGLIDESINMPGSATEMVSIGGNALDRATRSYFGRINYAYDSRYLFEANLRYDGSGRYHADHRWGAFPSFSAAWRISEEAFMENTRNWLDNLKIRASWGKLGNTGSNEKQNYKYDYKYLSTYALNKYSFNGAQAPGLASTVLANEILSWETTKSANIGIDANFLKNRLSLVLDFYDRKTTGILEYPSIYMTMGAKTQPLLNIAEMDNRGVELTLGWNDHVKDFHYSVSGNFSYNRNEVTKYKGKYQSGWTLDKDGKKVWSSNIGDVAKNSSEVTQTVEGKKFEEFFLKDVYHGNGNYFNSDGKVNINGGPKDGMIRTEDDMKWAQAMIAAGYTFMPNNKIAKDKLYYGDYIYADANGDGIYGSSADRVFQGISKHPKYNFGLQASASWKGFDISMNWAGAAGFKLYWGPATGYNSPSTRVGVSLPTDIAYNHYFYDPENPSDPRTNLTAKYGRLVNSEEGYANSEKGTTNYLFNGNYLKLKNLTIGYTLPKYLTTKASIQSVRFYLSGENLFNITSFPGQDPELGATPEYTSVRQFAFGTNITF